MSIEHISDELMQAYFEGKSVDRRSVELHVQICSSCRQHFSAYRRVFLELETGSQPVLSESFADKIMRRIAAREKRSTALRERLFMTIIFALMTSLFAYFFIKNGIGLIFFSLLAENIAPLKKYLPNDIWRLLGFSGLTLLIYTLLDHLLATQFQLRKGKQWS